MGVLPPCFLVVTSTSQQNKMLTIASGRCPHVPVRTPFLSSRAAVFEMQSGSMNKFLSPFLKMNILYRIRAW